MLSRNTAKLEEARLAKSSHASQQKTARIYVRTVNGQPKSHQLSPSLKSTLSLVLEALCQTLDKKVRKLEARDQINWIELGKCSTKLKECESDLAQLQGKEDPSELTSLVRKMFTLAKKQIHQEVNISEFEPQLQPGSNSARNYQSQLASPEEAYSSAYTASRLYQSQTQYPGRQLYDSLQKQLNTSTHRSNFLMVDKEYDFRRTDSHSRAWVFGPEYVPPSRKQPVSRNPKQSEGFNLYGLQRVNQLELQSRANKETLVRLQRRQVT